MIGKRNPITDDLTCLDCSQTLTRLQRLGGAQFCGESCRIRHSALAPHEVCAGCGRRLSPHQFGERLCGDIACRRLVEEQAREAERLRLEALRQEALHVRDRDGGALGVAQPDVYPVVVVPALRRRLVPLEEWRTRAFRDRLSRLIQEASTGLGILEGATPTPPAADPPSATSPSPSALAVMGQACALCRGWCCQTGGNHAYLTAETLRRALIDHPEQSPDDLLANYLGHLGVESVEGSCLFHQREGCGLPSAMRSDTCNRYFCPSLVEYRANASGQDEPRAFVAATAETRIVAAAFCGEAGARNVPCSEPEPSEPGVAGAASPDPDAASARPGARPANAPATVD